MAIEVSGKFAGRLPAEARFRPEDYPRSGMTPEDEPQQPSELEEAIHGPHAYDFDVKVSACTVIPTGGRPSASSVPSRPISPAEKHGEGCRFD
jgi:hypothetical protein